MIMHKMLHNICMKILLDKYMYKHSLTVRQVSILTSIPRSTVEDIASGRSIPRMDVMEQLAAGLGVRITDLFEEEQMFDKTIEIMKRLSYH